MKKEIDLLLSDYAYQTYINYMFNMLSKQKPLYSSSRYAISKKSEYDAYIDELQNKTFAEAFADFYKELEEIIIAASMREPDDRRETMEEGYIMMGFSGNYIKEVCEKLKDKSNKWLLDEEIRLKRKFEVLKFTEDFIKSSDRNLKPLESAEYYKE